MGAFKLEQQGGIHLWENCPCQDRVHTLRKGDVESVTLCDGAGSLNGAAAAAQAFSQGMNEWMADHYMAFRHTSRREIRRQAIREIDRILTALTCGVNSARDMYGSTLLTVCRDCRTGEALVMHLGDGMILGWSGQQRFSALTNPGRTEADRATWLVNNSPEALNAHLQVVRVPRSAHMDAFCLMSDGGEGALYQITGDTVRLHPVLGSIMQEYLLRPGSFEKAMPDFVKKRICPSDDFSMALLGDVSANALPSQASGRIRRQFASYLAARRSGAGIPQAARQAGWRKKDVKRKQDWLLKMQVEEV